MNTTDIAKVCHEINKAYCASIGDHTQKSWEEAEQWQRDSAIKGVDFALNNPDVPASSQHDAWLADKKKDGWNYGPIKDATLKQHPCIVPYDQLPTEQKSKDYLFKQVVSSLTPFIEIEVG